MNNHKKLGILLANLGTPQAPTPQAVKAFLSQFLHDQRVVDMSRWLWCPLLHGIILPTRSPKVAKLYQSIWMDEGSPLMVYSRRQRDKLAELSQRPVELGMTYGEPSLLDGVRKLQQQGVEQIVVLPLYPQYSATTTAAVFDGIAKALRQLPVVPELHFIRDYHDHPLYIQALAKSVRASWQLHGQGDLLLCSYHGIPKRYAQNGDIYPEHCKKTTELLAQALGLPQDKVMMTYQSQFGKEEWLQPYTDKTMEALPRQGIKKLDVICPAFSVDCLETLEEIAEQNQEIFLHSGGEAFHYVPCLNDSQSHIELMAALVKVDC
ncbi:ferrochelatase [Vibrio cholerae]|uniref:ferrochelatase n=1 Tax=Vibrio cholerae TaxID=666 RepID=UPI000D2216F9|nr:ferrochelatase [Vibrio cholerae]MCX9581143.1 ferrochelatase [Vibrio cholerae]MCX9585000.1 ferrochelatase [Vibrio cholerae]SPM19097.1 ferrochelatase,Ferrochelatase,ferrochelatase,Protoheme ferro-lyase (ferrochelatase),ferrochelatase,Ferrochelatase [Vibrio cholerae]GHZ81840.1 ferrochelatase [Vibrio cholerae]GIB39536.1 ferrochelatase [Vibrio cholerae]